MDTLIGVDLGQLVDFTAAAVIRRSMGIDGRGRPERDSMGRLQYRFDVAAVRRYPLGTSYTAIVAHVVDQLKRPELGRRPRLVVDATGVGVAVVEMFRSALKPLEDRAECYAVTITSGRAVLSVGRNEFHVAKIQLVGAIRAALESRRLKMPARLEHAETLKRELQDFKVKITDAGNETFSAREGAHDDLVLAVALPIWLAGLPRLEMVMDVEGFDPPRPHEQAAYSGEAAEILRLEREASMRERGLETDAMRAARLERDRLVRADPFGQLFGKPS